MKTLINISLLSLAILCVSIGRTWAQERQPWTGVGDGTPSAIPATIEQKGIAYGADIQVFPSERHQAEVSIALNNRNLANMLIGANTHAFGAIYKVGYFHTYNGGQSWNGGNVLPGTEFLQNDNPTVVYDAYTGNPNGYSNGYFNYLDAESFTDVRVFVSKTTDGGERWLGPVRVSPPQTFADRSSIATDITNGTHRNNIYVGYTDFWVSPSPIMFSRSTDLGNSFSTPVNISGVATALSHRA